MLKFLVFTSMFLPLTQSYAVELQNTLAPKKGQISCKVRYTSLTPNRTVDLNLGEVGYDFAELEKYDLVTGSYAQAGKIVVIQDGLSRVSIRIENSNRVVTKSNGLVIENAQEVFQFA